MEQVCYFTTGSDTIRWRTLIRSLGYDAMATSSSLELSIWARTRERPKALIMSLERLGDHVVELAEKMHSESEKWRGVPIIFIAASEPSTESNLLQQVSRKLGAQAKWLSSEHTEEEISRAIREPFAPRTL